LSSNEVVHVVDDDPDVQQSLAFLLSTAGLPVRVHDSAVAFLKVAENAEDGCIVTDVRMPGIDGLELQRRLRAAGNTTPVIVMTGHGDIALAVEAMKAGAIDFIEKPFDDEALLAAIKLALTRRQTERESSSKAAEVRNRLKLLSKRERQVLDGLVAGKPNKVIAYDLGISARTVEIYRANVMTKMQAPSLSALVRMVLIDAN
jgi:two-component system, LuxR family, response regulator FixJ